MLVHLHHVAVLGADRQGEDAVERGAGEVGLRALGHVAVEVQQLRLRRRRQPRDVHVPEAVVPAGTVIIIIIIYY